MKKSVVPLTNLSFHQLEDGSVVPTDVSIWSDYMLERVNHAIVEFFTHINQKDESDVMLFTLKNYILDLQPGINTRSEYDINIISEEVFNSSLKASSTVMGNIIRSLQKRNEAACSHNTLEKKFLGLYISDALYKNHPKLLIT